jgi:hypothetical protein
LEKVLFEHEHAPADAFLTAEGRTKTNIEQDIENIKHLDFGTVSRNLQWLTADVRAPTMRIIWDFLLPKKAMLLQTKRLLVKKGLSIAFDLPTHRGYDSDHRACGGRWKSRSCDRHCGRHESVVRPNSAR